MREIINTRFKCKGYLGVMRTDNNGDQYWEKVFKEGEWYSGRYETQRSEETFRLNGFHHYKYWITDSEDHEWDMTPAYFDIVFYSQEEEREEKINELLN